MVHLMAEENSVCRKRFNRLLMKKDIKVVKGIISPREQAVICSRLGTPNQNGDRL